MKRDDVLAQAEHLVPVLREHAERAEGLRRLPDELLDAVEQSDLFRLVAPRAHGGLGRGLEPLAQVTRILGRGCPASAWTLSFLIMHNWLLGRFPEAAQAEVFRARPWAFAPAPLAPTGRLLPEPGGFRLHGTWEWATGVCHADWVMVHAVEDADTFATTFVLIPADEVEVRDVWFMSGMLATGSNTVVAEGVFVPEHRAIPAMDLLQPQGQGDDGLSNLPVLAVLALVAAAPALGAAEAAVDFYQRRLHDRVLAYSVGDRQADQPAAQVRLSTARAEVRAAGALWEAAVGALSAAAKVPGGPTVIERADARLAAAATVRMARAAISTVCEGAGASVYASGSPLQRWQRDVEVLKGHVVFDWDRTAELAGRVALGFDLRPTDLV